MLKIFNKKIFLKKFRVSSDLINFGELCSFRGIFIGFLCKFSIIVLISFPNLRGGAGGVRVLLLRPGGRRGAQQRKVRGSHAPAGAAPATGARDWADQEKGSRLHARLWRRPGNHNHKLCLNVSIWIRTFCEQSIIGRWVAKLEGVGWLSREFSKKVETVLIEYSGAGGKLIHEKNQKQKISWHCPFNNLKFVPYFCFKLLWFQLAYSVCSKALVSVQKEVNQAMIKALIVLPCKDKTFFVHEVDSNSEFQVCSET